MKTLRQHIAIQCTCSKSGINGDFLIDINHFRLTGDLVALDGQVFDSLVELFHYANSKGLPTGRLYKSVEWSA